MPSINFNTANQTLRQLLGNGLEYRVPRFQRDFSWTQDEWDDLWQDVQATLNGSEPAHYMGYLVLQTQDNKTFDVIDGQQRLTTLSLMVLAVLKELQGLVDTGVDADDNLKRIQQLRNSYIGFLDPVTLIPRAKLTLNRNNDGFYTDYLVPLRSLPRRGLRASEHLLRKAFDWFHDQVRETYSGDREGATLAKFVDAMSDHLFFTVITVTDELNAFKVFETLNARGVRLSPTDLLKNYLFSVVSRESSHVHEIDTLERRWEAMVGQLGDESFPAFLRVHWNSRRKFVRQADLFKTIRTETPGKAHVFELLREMEEDIAVYAALSNPEDEFWDKHEQEHVAELRMFSVRQPWPLLLAAHRSFDKQGFGDFLRACSVVSFRYNVIGGRATNEQERVYNQVSLRIASGELKTSYDAIRALTPVYVGDAAFRTAFAEKVLRTTSARNKHIARYVLFSMERHLSGQVLDRDSPRYTLEHILPENPDDTWSEFSDEQVAESVYRLGNLTLIEASLNRGIGNHSFSDKRAAYAQSGFDVTRMIEADNDAWSFDRIAKRQQWMATQATSIWRISQLG